MPPASPATAPLQNAPVFLPEQQVSTSLLYGLSPLTMLAFDTAKRLLSVRCGVTTCATWNKRNAQFRQNTWIAACGRHKLLVFHESNSNIAIYVICLDKALPQC
jgi:hypothetical protein